MKIFTDENGFDSKGRKRIRESGQDLTIFRKDMNMFACSSQCPHKGGPLFLGKLLENGLMCPSHHIIFNTDTGKVVENPIPASMGDYRETGDLKIFKIETDEKGIKIEI